MKNIEKFARRCDATGKGMNEGFCFNDGDKYFLHEEDAKNYALELGYSSLKKSYKAGVHYWTEWEVQEDENYFDAEGNEYNCHGIEIIENSIGLLASDFNEEDIPNILKNIDDLPTEVASIIKKWISYDFDFSYEQCQDFVDELETAGYTCEYDLNGVPYNLRAKE